MKTDNELISEFMGYRYESGIYNGAVVCRDNKKFEPAAFKYSWDWLMPIIEKVDQLHSAKFKYDFKNIALGDWPKDHEYIEVISLPMATKIEEVYSAVITFIKWYNKQEK